MSDRPPGGPGAVVSTTQVATAGDNSVRPLALAVMARLCVPSPTVETVTGLVQGLAVPPSTLHWNVAPAMVEWNVVVAELELVGLGGVESSTVSGGVVEEKS